MRKYCTTHTETAAQFIECLGSMGNIVHDDTSLHFTSAWIKSIDRGGLLQINDSTFRFFRAIEIKVQELLPHHIISQTSNKDSVIKAIMEDEDVQFLWCMISTDVTEEDSCTLLGDIVELFVTTRRFAMTGMWLAEYKKARDKNIKKSKSLRDELKKKTST